MQNPKKNKILAYTDWYWGVIYNTNNGKVGAENLRSWHNVYLMMSSVVINVIKMKHTTCTYI